MAYSTTLTSVSTKLREGWAEWIKTGYTLLGQYRAMLLAHTHTGTVDGAQIATGGYAAGSIVAADLASNSVTTAKITDANVTTAKIADANVTTAKIADANVTAVKVADGVLTSGKQTTAAKTHTSITKWLDTATAGDTELPVFKAPVACVVSAAYVVTAANVVGNATDYNTLYLKKYTAGVLGGTLCTANSGTAGTWLAMQEKSLGAVTGGTLAANDVLSLAKATVAGGTAIGDSLACIDWYATAA